MNTSLIAAVADLVASHELLEAQLRLERSRVAELQRRLAQLEEEHRSFESDAYRLVEERDRFERILDFVFLHPSNR